MSAPFPVDEVGQLGAAADGLVAGRQDLAVALLSRVEVVVVVFVVRRAAVGGSVVEVDVVPERVLIVVLLADCKYQDVLGADGRSVSLENALSDVVRVDVPEVFHSPTMLGVPPTSGSRRQKTL